MKIKRVEVLIVGAGVTGAATAQVIANYTNIESFAVVEKNSAPALVNSNVLNNAQTSHDGGTETNYSLPHALHVKEAAVALRRYVVANDRPGLYAITTRMALAVGSAEVAKLRERYEVFKDAYPDLRLAEAAELSRLEPMVMEGRDPNEPVLALVSNEGYAINYHMLAEVLLEDAQKRNPAFEQFYDTTITDIRREGDVYVIETDMGQRFMARVVVFAAGAYSLWFAHKLGYGLEYALMSVGGNFYSANRPLLNGKVYRVQQENLPFAEVHGDPNVLDHAITRFGPTTKPLLQMERHRPESFVPFISLGLFTWRGLTTLARIMSRKGLFGYILQNYCYDVPFFGKRLFLRKIRKIIPTIKVADLRWHENMGGIRPQIVNLRTGALEMGEKTIEGENAIFETTPSPGASVCMLNAVKVAGRVVEFLGAGYTINRSRIADELGIFRKQQEAA